MTVDELIDALSLYDPAAQVAVSDRTGWDSSAIASVASSGPDVRMAMLLAGVAGFEYGHSNDVAEVRVLPGPGGVVPLLVVTGRRP